MTLKEFATTRINIHTVIWLGLISFFSIYISESFGAAPFIRFWMFNMVGLAIITFFDYLAQKKQITENTRVMCKNEWSLTHRK